MYLINCRRLVAVIVVALMVLTCNAIITLPKQKNTIAYEWTLLANTLCPVALPLRRKWCAVWSSNMPPVEVQEQPLQHSRIPASTNIRTRKYGWKLARDVVVGDQVWTPRGWEEVYFLSHSDHQESYSFLRLRLNNGMAVSISPGQYVRANGKYTVGSDVRKQMQVEILVDGEETTAKVVAVEETREIGAFGIYSTGGDFYANNILISSHSISKLDLSPEVQQWAFYPVHSLFKYRPDILVTLSILTSARPLSVFEMNYSQIIPYIIDSIFS